jgi:DNA-binding response OmpR family regulator
MIPTILTITSDPQIGSILQQILASIPIEMIVKDSLQLAAHYLRSGEVPQLIILDWVLQGGFAPDFLKQMRALTRFAELPVLVIVAEPDPDTVKAALQAGANRYLTRGYIQNNFLRTLREMQIIVPEQR